MSAAVDTYPDTRLDAPRQDVAQPIAPMPCSRIHDGWIVVHSYPQAERWARDNLNRRGYETYLPLMAVSRRDRVIRSLRHTVDVPLFPRYLFVRFPGNWTPVRYCPGVYRIVSAAGKPNLASNAAISALQAAQAVRASLPLPSRKWAPGTPCVVGNGMFDEVPAVILQVGTEMATVAMMWFGHLREVAVQLDCLIARDE